LQGSEENEVGQLVWSFSALLFG